MPGFASQLRDRLGQRAERRLPALTRHRVAESLPVHLHSRRVYILPTRFGLVLASVVGAMLIGALNFNNNPALLLGFLVSAVAVLSFHQTVAQLRGLSLLSLRAEPVHAGDPLAVEWLFENDSANPRHSLVLDQGEQRVGFVLAAESRAAVRLALATERRGWLQPGRVRLSCEYPFGIVRAWSWLHPEQSLLVYPRPEPQAPPLPAQAGQDPGQRVRLPGDDWHGLRDHHGGDSPRRIAWKASARSDRLLVKEFAEPLADALVLDFEQLPGLDPEQRIERLTRWVLDARDQQLSFRLLLPGRAIGPGQGPEFAARCLRELALLP